MVRGCPEVAIEEMVHRFQDELFSYACRILRNHADAQEVTQDAFLRAYRALTQRYGEERRRNLAMRPWLFRITRNLALNRLRAGRGAAAELGEADQSKAGSPSSPADTLARKQQRLRLEQALGRLNEDQRELILLRFMEEMRYAEISAVVGISEAAVRGQVFRALRRLRQLLVEIEGSHAM